MHIVLRPKRLGAGHRDQCWYVTIAGLYMYVDFHRHEADVPQATFKIYTHNFNRFTLYYRKPYPHEIVWHGWHWRDR